MTTKIAIAGRGGTGKTTVAVMKEPRYRALESLQKVADRLLG
jgi:CO dehydrogenase nickel-insertion accessory protein CooC1